MSRSSPSPWPFPATSNTPSPSTLPGSASLESKTHVLTFHTFMGTPGCFGGDIVSKMEWVEVGWVQAKDIPSRQLEGERNGKVGKVVMTLKVEEDMVNEAGELQEGIMAFIIDTCSTLPLVIHSSEVLGDPIPGVTQSLETSRYAPALAGDTLLLTNYSIAMGEVMTARAEIYNLTREYLVCSATHTKMKPSAPKRKAKM